MYRQEFQVLGNHSLEGWRKQGEPQGLQVAFFLQTLSLGRDKTGKAFCPALLIPIRCLGITKNSDAPLHPLENWI